MAAAASPASVALAGTDTTQAALDAYAKDISFVNPVRPAGVVQPKNAEEVQRIIEFANRTRTPLVPVSSGPPHFRGDTVPSVGGAMIVDLSGMNRIVNVQRANRVAMCEPGVTFGELIAEVAKHGLRLNMPLLPRKTKSVVGSLLGREPVVMPKYQWDISDPLACAGLFFGTGDEFRTGQAAGPGTIEEQWAVGAMQKAPYRDRDAFLAPPDPRSSGTMGIVTWASMRCELQPSLEEPFVLGSPQLQPLLELGYWLIRLRMANECFILNNTNLAAIFAQDSPNDYQNLKATLPPWILFYTVAGYEYFPEERVGSQLKDIMTITQRLGVEPVKAAGAVSANAILKAVQQPSAEPYWKLRPKGACQDVLYLTMYEKLETQVAAMSGLAEKAGYPAANLGVYIQPVVQGTSYHCEFNLFYDPENRQERTRVKESLPLPSGA